MDWAGVNIMKGGNLVPGGHQFPAARPAWLMAGTLGLVVMAMAIVLEGSGHPGMWDVGYVGVVVWLGMVQRRANQGAAHATEADRAFGDREGVAIALLLLVAHVGGWVVSRLDR